MEITDTMAIDMSLAVSGEAGEPVWGGPAVSSGAVSSGHSGEYGRGWEHVHPLASPIDGLGSHLADLRSRHRRRCPQAPCTLIVSVGACLLEALSILCIIDIEQDGCCKCSFRLVPSFADNEYFA
jgi:hypothetical protein